MSLRKRLNIKAQNSCKDWQTMYAHAKAKFEKAKEVLDVVQQFMEDFNNFVIASSSDVSIIKLIEIEEKHK
jgi:hypothetical protein